MDIYRHILYLRSHKMENNKTRPIYNRFEFDYVNTTGFKMLCARATSVFVDFRLFMFSFCDRVKLSNTNDYAAIEYDHCIIMYTAK